MIENVILSEYLHDIELVSGGGSLTEMQDHLTMTGYCRYGNNVFLLMFILIFDSIKHMLSRTKKATHYLLVTDIIKQEKQISIIE